MGALAAGWRALSDGERSALTARAREQRDAAEAAADAGGNDAPSTSGAAPAAPKKAAAAAAPKAAAATAKKAAAAAKTAPAAKPAKAKAKKAAAAAAGGDSSPPEAGAKRPLTGYALFGRRNRAALVAAHPREAPFSAIGAAWRDAGDAERARWAAMAAAGET
jgi:hypothetical protein